MNVYVFQLLFYYGVCMSRPKVPFSWSGNARLLFQCLWDNPERLKEKSDLATSYYPLAYVTIVSSTEKKELYCWLCEWCGQWKLSLIFYIFPPQWIYHTGSHNY